MMRIVSHLLEDRNEVFGVHVIHVLYELSRVLSFCFHLEVDLFMRSEASIHILCGKWYVCLRIEETIIILKGSYLHHSLVEDEKH